MKNRFCVFILLSAAFIVSVGAQSVSEQDISAVGYIYSSSLDVYQKCLGRFFDFRVAAALQPSLNMACISGDDLDYVANASKHVRQKLEKIQAAFHYINGYVGTDWDEKFGRTGLWQATKEYEVKLKIMLCQLDYLRFSAGKCQEDEPDERLVDLLRNLDEILGQVSSADAEAMALRICRHLSGFQERYRQEFEERASIILGKYKSLKNADTEVLMEYLLFKADRNRHLKEASKKDLKPVYEELADRFETMTFYNQAVFSFADAVYVEGALLESFLESLDKEKKTAEFEILLRTSVLLPSSESMILEEMKAGYILDCCTDWGSLQDVSARIYQENRKSRLLLFAAGMLKTTKAAPVAAEGFKEMIRALDFPATGWRESILPTDSGFSIIRRMLYEAVLEQRLTISDICRMYPSVRKQGTLSYDDYRYDYEIALLNAQSRDCGGLELLEEIAGDAENPFNCHARYSSAAVRYERIESAGNTDYTDAVGALKDILLSAECPPDITCDAKALYSQLILMKNDLIELEQLADDLLGENDLSCNEHFPAVAAEVFLRAQRPLEALRLMKKYPANFENETALVDQAAAEVMLRYEFYASKADNEEGLFDVLFVMKQLYTNPDPVQRAMLSEAVLLMEEPEIAKLGEFDVTDQTPLEIIRFMARLSEKTGNYPQAADLWGRLASHALAAEQNWLYSKSKYYQLKNAAQGNLEQAEKLIRACRVLLSARTFDDFWKSRVDLLVQDINNDL
jgi:hypothetical protein